MNGPLTDVKGITYNKHLSERQSSFSGNVVFCEAAEHSVLILLLVLMLLLILVMILVFAFMLVLLLVLLILYFVFCIQEYIV